MKKQKLTEKVLARVSKAWKKDGRCIGCGSLARMEQSDYCSDCKQRKDAKSGDAS